MFIYHFQSSLRIADTSAHRLATKFCQDATNNTEASFTQLVTPAEAGIKYYAGYEFGFAWTKSNENCSPTSCIETFSGFLSSSVCNYDSHTMSVQGKNVDTCGTAAFIFSDSNSSVSTSNATSNAISDATSGAGTTRIPLLVPLLVLPLLTVLL